MEIFQSALKDGTISADCTLEKIKTFVTAFERDGKEVYKSYTPKPPKLNLASIRVDPTDFKKHKSQILNLLKELQDLGLVIKLGKEFEQK